MLAFLLSSLSTIIHLFNVCPLQSLFLLSLLLIYDMIGFHMTFSDIFISVNPSPLPPHETSVVFFYDFCQLIVWIIYNLCNSYVP